MKNLLIIDDEALLRRSLRNLIDWTGYGYRISAEAINGKDALEIIEREQIDIALTDLTMPEMDGIEFISECRNRGVEIPIIVLTAHDDFHLVRRAFQLGVRDYILKTEMTKQTLLAVLNATQNVSKPDINEDPTLRAIIREGLLHDLLIGNTQSRSALQTLTELNEGIFKGKTVVLTIQFCTPEKTSAKINRAFENAKSRLRNRCEILVLDSAEIVALPSFPDNTDWKSIMETVQEFCREITEEFQKKGITHFAAGLSTQTSWIENQKAFTVSLDKLFSEARMAVRHAFLAGNNRVIYFHAIRNNRNPSALDSPYLQELLKKTIRSGNPDAMDRAVELLRVSAKRFNTASVPSIRNLYRKYADILMGYADSGRIGCAPQIRNDTATLIENIESGMDLSALNHTLEAILNEITLYFRSSNPVINNAILFIQSNFRKNFTLNDAAEATGVSAVHLSKLFSKKMGISLMRYREELRIEKAVEMLQINQKKIYEIADELGYSSPEHFNKNFKKITGTTPSKYLG